MATSFKSEDLVVFETSFLIIETISGFLSVFSGLSPMLDLLNNLTVTCRLNSGKSWLAADNFCAFQITNLGERETRIKTNRIKLIETTEPSQGENFLFVKEAVKRNRLVWLVYQDKHHIIDCNISTNVHDLVKFDKKFSSYGRDWITNKFHENGKAAEYSSDIDFRGLLRQCRLFKRQIRCNKDRASPRRAQQQKVKK